MSEDPATGGPRPRWFRASEFAVALAVSFAAVLAVPGCRENWFSHDDFFQVRWVSTRSPLELLASPDAWASLPMKLVTPALFLSLRLDHHLGGFAIEVYRWHQLGSWAALAACLYFVLRLFHRRLDALGGCAVALLGPAVTGLLPLLMVRHYLEGLALALLAVALFVLAVRRAEGRNHRGGALGWSLLSAAIYAGSALAKEVFVPLPIVLLALPLASLRRRARWAVPHGVVLAAYPFYRRFLLGEWLGGYGMAADPADMPGLLISFPVRLLGQAAEPGGSWGWALVLVAALGACGLLARGPAYRVLAAALALACLVPLVPAAASLTPRLAAVPWFALAVAVPAVIAGLPMRRRALAWLTVSSLVLATHWTAWSATRAEATRVDRENHAFLRLHAPDLVRSPVSPSEALFELGRWKRDLLNAGPGPAWFVDDLFLCRLGSTGGRIWQWDAVAREVVDRTESSRVEALDHCRTIRWESPLSARFAWRGQRLRWELGPYSKGTYRLLVDDGVVRVEVPRTASFRRESGPLWLRVRYDSPAGWSTYSEPIYVEPDHEANWARPDGVVGPDSPSGPARRRSRGR